MKALFIGGTGTISTAISRRVLDMGWDLYLLNRGNGNAKILNDGFVPFKRFDAFTGASVPGAERGKLIEINCDIRAESEADVAKKIRAHLKAGEKFDVVADFIIFTQEEVERDYRLFKDITNQYFFISSASACQKPLMNHIVNEGTVYSNPLWLYSRNKIACENFLTVKYREEGFPITLIRPAHTYDERSVPLGAHGNKGSWQVLKRIIEGKKVIIHGDGTSLWTMTANRDFAKGFCGLMGNIHAIGETVQITSDEVLTWNQIYLITAQALGKELKAVHVSSEFLTRAGKNFGFDYEGQLAGDKANSYVFDNSKLKRLVPGFTATVRFDQGAREAVDYILSHKECQIEDPEFDSFCDKVIAAQEKAAEEVKK